MPAKTRSQIEPAVQSQRLAALRDVRQVILAHLAEEALLTHLGENPMGAPDGSVSEMNRAALASRDTLRSVPGDCFHTLCALGEFASACVLATRVGEQAAKSFLVACSGARNSARQRKLQAEWRAVHGAPEATEAAPAPPPKVVVPRKPLKRPRRLPTHPHAATHLSYRRHAGEGLPFCRRTPSQETPTCNDDPLCTSSARCPPCSRRRRPRHRRGSRSCSPW